MTGGISIVDIGAGLRAETSFPNTERLKHMSPARMAHIRIRAQNQYTRKLQFKTHPIHIVVGIPSGSQWQLRCNKFAIISYDTMICKYDI